MNDDALTFSPVTVLPPRLCHSGSVINSKINMTVCAIYRRPRLGDCRWKEQLRVQEERLLRPGVQPQRGPLYNEEPEDTH